MQTNRFIAPRLTGLAAFCAALLSATAVAQDSGSVNQAFQAAKQSIDPSAPSQLVSVYGLGTPAAVQKWFVIFYDPAVSTHGRVVLVEGGKVTKSYPANGGVTYSEDLTFDSSQITSEGPALSSAQGYAAKNHLAYDSVTALLKQSSRTQPFRWKIGLILKGKLLGYVLISPLDDSVAAFVSPSADATGPSTAVNGDKGFFSGVKRSFHNFGNDVKNFFDSDDSADKQK